MSRLNSELLLRAYAAGIFPMAEGRADSDLFWVDPDWRGVIPLERFHLPKRLGRTIRRGVFEVRCNTAFEQVIHACAEAAARRADSWINAEIVRLYSELHEMGHAHSIECWREGELAGGLYGVSLAAAFFGESMFTRQRDASKVALVHLVARLKLGGFRLLDTQFLTRHLEQFGAVELPRPEYRRMLADALAVSARFQSELAPATFDDFLQSMTQTS